MRWSRRRAKDRNLDHNLTWEWVKNKILEGCPVTGKAFDLTCKGSGKKRALGPSLDRIDNSKGYTVDNTRVICLWYNLAKWNWDDEFIRNVIKETITFWEEECS